MQEGLFTLPATKILAPRAGDYPLFGLIFHFILFYCRRYTLLCRATWQEKRHTKEFLKGIKLVVLPGQHPATIQLVSQAPDYNWHFNVNDCLPDIKVFSFCVIHPYLFQLRILAENTKPIQISNLSEISLKFKYPGGKIVTYPAEY